MSCFQPLQKAYSRYFMRVVKVQSSFQETIRKMHLWSVHQGQTSTDHRAAALCALMVSGQCVHMETVPTVCSLTAIRHIPLGHGHKAVQVPRDVAFQSLVVELCTSAQLPISQPTVCTGAFPRIAGEPPVAEHECRCNASPNPPCSKA